MMGIRRLLPLAVITLVLACGGGDDDPLGPSTSKPDPKTGLTLSTNETATGDSTPLSGPTIETDKLDYAPTETVAMIGTGWNPGETVTLTLAENPQVHEVRTYTVTADSLGSFRFEGFSPEEHHAGVAFLLTAVGSSGAQAQATFTDAIAQLAATSNFNSTAGNDRFRLIFSTPAANAGDILVAQITVSKDIPSTEVICPPSGWQHVITTKWASSGPSKFNQAVFYLVVSANRLVRPDTFNFRQNSCAGALPTTPRGAAGGIIRYSGVDVSHPNGPIEGSLGAGTGSSSVDTASAPSVPAISQGARVIRFFGLFKAQNANNGTPITPGAGRIYLAGSTNNSAERTAAAFDAAQASTGPTGTFQRNFASSAEWLTQTVVLRMKLDATTTTLTPSPANEQTFGQSVTFTAAVKKSDNSAVNAGMVRFYDAAANASCANLGTSQQIGTDQAVNPSNPNQGQAQVSTTTLTVGEHTILACYLGTATFQASSASLEYEINPAQAATALAAAPASGTYGGTTSLSATLMAGSTPVPGKTISFTLNGSPVGTAVTGASGVATLANISLAGINAGTYPTAIGASFAGDATHVAATATPASLTVGKAELTVTAHDKTKIYGDPDPEFTFAYTGFVLGENASVIDQPPTCAAADPHINVGTYAITCSGGEDNNYTFVYQPGTLKIEKAELAVTAHSHTTTYGDPTPAFTFGYSGFKIDDDPADLNTAPTCSVAGPHTDAGSYTIVCAGGDDNNYKFLYVNGTLTVNQAPLTVTANNQVMITGDPDPVFTLAYSGFVLQETPAVLDVQPTCTVSQPHVDPGPYPIVCSGGMDNNYQFIYVDGILTVKRRTFLLVLDEDAIDNGGAPNFFSAFDVNDQIARIGLRTQLPGFAARIGSIITLPSGQVGDEGWFALKTIPSAWMAAGPTADGARNLLVPGPHLGNPSDALLDKVPDVTPLRAAGLKLLANHRFQVCAVVWDSDIGMNYGPLNGSLKGANLGIVALQVEAVTRVFNGSSSTLPKITVRVVSARDVCAEPLKLLTDAPAPSSSSSPFDVNP
jgi:hypothetical protein